MFCFVLLVFVFVVGVFVVVVLVVAVYVVVVVVDFVIIVFAVISLPMLFKCVRKTLRCSDMRGCRKIAAATTAALE